MTKPKRPLSDVVKERQKSEGCMLCTIPEREEIEAERKNGAEIRDIAAWLVKDCGYDEEWISQQRKSNRMTRHFERHCK
jgi:hypothetical protein